MIATSGWMRHVAGGWTGNGITTLQKGAPLVIISAFKRFNGTERPRNPA